MRIHKIINVDKALKWLNSHGFAMDNLSLGAEDIVDGNMKLTMGLIWMLIMVCSISSGAGDIKRTRAAILNWCKRILRYYHEAGLISPSVSDFSQSWRNGVAFLALCH
ncbi:calponin homology domain-containing protein, partial [Cladochytrium replicatum]